MELSFADWVVAVTPLLNTPELEVSPPNKVFLAAISTPSTVPVVSILWKNLVLESVVSILSFPPTSIDHIFVWNLIHVSVSPA